MPNSSAGVKATRVISTDPDRKVNIYRIHNNRITSISIVASARVAKRTSREIITILN